MVFFTSERVADCMTAIRTCTGEYLYLIEGKERAALIDCSVGAGSLKQYVEQLTNKPVIVLLTHGHVDHAPGSSEFEHVYLNHKDLSLCRSHCRMEERLDYLRSSLKEQFDELKESDLVPSIPDKVFFELEDNAVFDLGGLHIRAIAFPGHTMGSMVFLVEESGLLILGDACNNTTFVFFQESDTIEAYRSTAERVRQLVRGRFDRVFISHHDPEAPAEVLDNVIDVCNEILTGTADSQPYSFRGISSFFAKAVDTWHHRIDGKYGNVVYSKEKLWSV